MYPGPYWKSKIEKKKEVKVSKPELNERLNALFVRLVDMSDQFENLRIKENDEFIRGQFDGRSLAYADCAIFIAELKESI